MHLSPDNQHIVHCGVKKSGNSHIPRRAAHLCISQTRRTSLHIPRRAAHLCISPDAAAQGPLLCVSRVQVSTTVVATRDHDAVDQNMLSFEKVDPLALSLSFSLS